jgi:hypothetical protein
VTKIDETSEERVRKWPVWFARLSNLFIGWTANYCAAGCGYPITNRFNYKLETYKDVPIRMAICSVGGECEEKVKSDPRDEAGNSYADFRPLVIESIKQAEAKNFPMVSVDIAFGR